MEVNDKVRQVREKLLITQEELARRLNVSFPTGNKWENGRAMPKMLKLKTFESFCKDNEISLEE